MTYDGERRGETVDILEARLKRTRTMINPDIRALFDYWERIRAGRSVPYRAEVDPRDMACDARHLFILEDLGQQNYRFRLAGTALVDAFGMELRGMSARTIMEGQGRESFAALIEETLAEPGIGYARLVSALSPNEIWELLLLPLRSDFGGVDRVLGGLQILNGRARRLGEDRLRFHIEELSIRPVTEGRQPGAPVPVMGFADAQTPFSADERPSPLRAIDGGLSEDEGEEGQTKRAGGKPYLRLVKDD